MARIQPLEGREAPVLLRLLNTIVRRMFGQEMTPLNVIGHSPGLIVPFLAMSRFATSRTALSPTIRLLAMQRVATINGCGWCLDIGAYEAAKLGVDSGKLRALLDYQASSLFDDCERAALAYAEAVSQVGATVSDRLFADLQRHFSDREIVELTASIAAENFYNRLNVPLEIEAQGFCALPAAVA